MALGRHWTGVCTPERVLGPDLRDLNQLQYHNSVCNNDTTYLAIFMCNIQLLEFILFIEALSNCNYGNQVSS